MVRFGLALQTFTSPGVDPDVQSIVKMAKTAESLGFDSVWVWDHLLLGSKRVYPILESVSMLSALAMVTSKVKLGVSTLILPLRDPVLLAKQAQTIAYLSSGRLVLGVAAGWYEKEFNAVGAKMSERGKTTEAYLGLLRKLLNESDINVALGERTFVHTSMEPRPKAPVKILMGGYKVLRRIGQMSDGWIASYYTPEDFRETWLEILKYARDAGRNEKDLAGVNILPVSVRNDFNEADQIVRKFTAEYMDMPSWGKSKVESGVRGTPKECVEQIKKYEAAGVGTLEFIPCYYDIECVERVGKEVIPHFIKK